ncbi:protein mono-ADP-ribosyltransferase PARP15-like [Thalassophryne amazonica]|uniref:protein mono-ADP-ribosyltransferase PARP15-like n=1 Tax=Thalassophryne amazonica TaxID=390379 RepID=UPI001471751E|nr:protein mono-ADP-ribosyltransferase PARP15-like [Thalassophryne amazonica]
MKQSIFQIVGLSETNVEHAMAKMKQLYQTQCATETIDIEGFTDQDMKYVMDTMATVSLHYAKEESDKGVLKITGPKDGINTLRIKMIARKKSIFRKEVRARDEDKLYSQVSWCIMGADNNWEKLPMKANYDLEMNDVMGGIMDAQQIQWTVDRSMTAQTGGQTRQLKRLQNLQDFNLPLYWDNMTADENLKVVQLQSTSAEYRKVKSEFRKTAANPIIKIERVQNIYLRCAYEVHHRRISDNNRQLGQDIERTLYHGTTEDSCKSIMTSGFNRSYCGQNATVFGFGTYFAVDASYSTNLTYSKPAADGSQFMLVARVLTGSYTVGHKDMKVPPARNAQQPHNLYDSVVNNLNKPTMFVVFHDYQAYPDYLITFKSPSSQVYKCRKYITS